MRRFKIRPEKNEPQVLCQKCYENSNYRGWNLVNNQYYWMSIQVGERIWCGTCSKVFDSESTEKCWIYGEGRVYREKMNHCSYSLSKN